MSQPDSVPHIKPLLVSSLHHVALDVADEIQRQDDLARAGKFGGTHILPGGPDQDRLTVLVEEVGEIAKALNEKRQGSPSNLYEEIIQTAASASAWAAAHREGR